MVLTSRLTIDVLLGAVILRMWDHITSIGEPLPICYKGCCVNRWYVIRETPWGAGN